MRPSPLSPAGWRPLRRRWRQLALGHLARKFERLIPFAVVGLSGLLVNSAVLAAATHFLGLGQLIFSTILATAGSTAWNFTLTELWVFRARRRPGWPRRLVLFFLLNQAALLLRGPLIYALTFTAGVHYLLSNALSIGAVTLLRYLFAEALIWRTAARRKSAPFSTPESPHG